MTRLLQFRMKYLKKARSNAKIKRRQTLTIYLLTIGINYRNINI